MEVSANDGIKAVPMRKEPAELIQISALSTRGLRFVAQPRRQHTVLTGDLAG